MKLAIVGDVLLDRDVGGMRRRLSPDASVPVLDGTCIRERPGGAGVAALVARHLGARVALVTALGQDQASRRVWELLRDAGVHVTALPTDGETAEKSRILDGDRPVARIDRGELGRIDAGGAHAREVAGVLASADAVLVSDYGRGVPSQPPVRAALARAVSRPLVWDPHPRGAPPVGGAWLLTPNEHEVDGVTPAAGGRTPAWSAVASRAAQLRRAARARAISVTLGERGALLVTGDGPPLYCPCTPVTGGDLSGAGDAFAVGAALALARGAVHSEAVMAGVETGSTFVRGMSRATWTAGDTAPPPAATTGGAGGAGDAGDRTVIDATRAAGGTVVMTGGCFDVLHRGHVELLRHARSLGDCLVVCLNSDESVRRLKGEPRPVTAVEDRARVLLALESVDDVVVFDEDTPAEVLRRHRPHVFVKGGDYGGVSLPEAPVLEEWGGQVVIVPYVNGYSTTRLLEDARHGR